MSNQENTSSPNSETDAFPYSPEEELNQLQEVTRRVGAEVFRIGGDGYLVQNPRVKYIAEAPLVLLDFDDTAARTTDDKKRCGKRLQGLGLPPEVIAYCDKISRVRIGDEDPMYEPELDMRLLSFAKGTLSPALQGELDELRIKLIRSRNLDSQGVDPGVRNIYQETRFISTLYPDTQQTLQALRRHPEQPANVGILTYGDPSFQLQKTISLLNETNVAFLCLTKVKKGKFFQSLTRQNPFRQMDLEYHYPETPRGVGVDFKGWGVQVMLFDDDPKQVQSFNSVAESEGLPALAVVRVRRTGVKRASTDTTVSRFVAEVKPSDTFLDTQLFEFAIAELQTRALELYLEGDVTTATRDDPSVLNHSDVKRIIETVSECRGVPYDVVRDNILNRSGYRSVVTVPNDEGKDRQIWRSSVS